MVDLKNKHFRPVRRSEKLTTGGEKMKTYEIQVMENGRYEAIKFQDKENFFTTKSEAEREMNNYQNRYPYKLRLRVEEATK
jgi:hypothetical protein